MTDSAHFKNYSTNMNADGNIYRLNEASGMNDAEEIDENRRVCSREDLDNTGPHHDTSSTREQVERHV